MALAWLGEYLKLQRASLDKDASANGYSCQAGLRTILQHNGLASVRQPALGNLPARERAAWENFWSEVETLLARAEDATPGPPGSGKAIAAEIARAHVKLAKLLQEKGQRENAMAELHRAIVADPRFAEAHYTLGLLLREKNQDDDAIAAFRRTTAVDPTFAAAHDQLGWLLRIRGKLEEAVLACRRAIDLQPREPNFHNSLACALRDQDKLPEAIAEFRLALELDGRFSPAATNLADAERRLAARNDGVGLVYRLTWTDQEQRKNAHIGWSLFTPDGKTFLAGGDAGPKGRIRLWDVATGKQLQQLTPGGDPWFNAGVLLPDGKKLLAWYTLDSNLYLWELATGKLLRKFAGPGPGPRSVAVGGDGKHFLAGGNDKVLHLYDFETGEEVARLAGHDDKCDGVFSPGGRLVLSFGPDRVLCLWDADNGELLHRLEGHTAACTGLFSPDGKQVLSYGDDRTVRLWDAATGAVVRSFAGPTDEVIGAAFVSGGEKIAAWGKDQSVRIWERGSGKLLHQFDLGGKAGTWPNVALSPDGRRLLVHRHPTLYVLDLATGKEVQRFDNAVRATGFSFSPDGRYVAAGSHRAGIYLWLLPK